MFGHGMKASELIVALQRLIEKHGDKEVYSGGGDYPEGVRGVRYVAPKNGDAYVPGDSFKL